MVSQGVVRVNLRSRFRVFHDESGQGFALGIRNDLGPNLIAGAILHSGHGSFPYRSAPCQSLTLRLGHVLALAAEVALIDFHGTGEGRPVAIPVPGPSLTDSMQHEPSRGLSDTYIPCQFQGRNALEAGDLQVNGYDPLAEFDVAMRQGCPGSDGEILAAVAAPVGHGFSVGNVVGVNAAAVTAAPFAIPQGFLKPFSGRFLVGKHLQQLHNSDAISVGFPCGFRSLFRVPHDGNIIQRLI